MAHTRTPLVSVTAKQRAQMTQRFLKNGTESNR